MKYLNTTCLALLTNKIFDGRYTWLDKSLSGRTCDMSKLQRYVENCSVIVFDLWPSAMRWTKARQARTNSFIWLFPQTIYLGDFFIKIWQLWRNSFTYCSKCVHIIQMLVTWSFQLISLSWELSNGFTIVLLFFLQFFNSAPCKFQFSLFRCSFTKQMFDLHQATDMSCTMMSQYLKKYCGGKDLNAYTVYCLMHIYYGY